MTNTELLAKIKAEIDKLYGEYKDKFHQSGDQYHLGLIDGLDMAERVLSTIEPEKPINPDAAMKELDEKIAIVKQRGTWDDVDVDKYMDEVRGRVSGDLEEAADNHIRKVADAAGHPGWDWTTQDIADSFIAGAEWQYQKDRREFAQIKAKTWCEGFDACKEQMLKEAEETDLYWDGDFLAIDLNMAALGYSEHDKVRVIVCKKED